MFVLKKGVELKRIEITLLGFIIMGQLTLSAPLSFQEGVVRIKHSSDRAYLQKINQVSGEKALQLQQEAPWKKVDFSSSYQHEENTLYSDPEQFEMKVKYNDFYYSYDYSFAFDSIDSSQIGMEKKLNDWWQESEQERLLEKNNLEFQQSQIENLIAVQEELGKYIDAYCQWWIIQSKIEDLTIQEETQNLILNAMKERATDSVTALEVEKAKIDLEKIISDKIVLKQEQRKSEIALEELLNLPFEKELSLEPLTVEAESFSTASEDLLITQAELKSTIAKTNLVESLEGSQPQLTWSYGYDLYFNSWISSLTLSLSLFDFSSEVEKNRGIVKSTQYDCDVVKKKQQVKKLNQEATLKIQQESYQMSQKELQYYEKALEVAMVKWESAMITYDEYSKEVAKKSAAEQAMQEAKYQLIAMEKKQAYGIDMISND